MLTFKKEEKEKVVSFLSDSTSILNGPVNSGVSAPHSRFAMIKKEEDVLLLYSGFLDSSEYFQMMKIDKFRWLCTGCYNSPELYEACAFEISLEQDKIKVKEIYTAPGSSLTEKNFFGWFEFVIKKLDDNSTMSFNDYNAVLAERSAANALFLNVLNLDTYKYQELLRAILPKLDDSLKQCVYNNDNRTQLSGSFSNSIFKPSNTNIEDENKGSENKTSIDYRLA